MRKISRGLYKMDHIYGFQGREWLERGKMQMQKTDEKKIVTPQFVLGFCHGQLRFCLLVRIGLNRQRYTLYNKLSCKVTTGGLLGGLLGQGMCRWPLRAPTPL